MLTKSKTKYSYARRIFALPLLFMLSFAYLVNAKNKEIKKTNIEIEQAVQGLKKDTAIVDTSTLSSMPKALQSAREGLSSVNSQINNDNKLISEINKKISDKNKAINDLIKAKKDDSQEFLTKTKEVEALANETDKIINSDRYQAMLKKSDDYAKQIDEYYNAPEWKEKLAQIEKNAKQMEKKYNSPEWKKKMADIEKQVAEIEKRVNSPEFKKRIEEIRKNASNVYFYKNDNLAKDFDVTNINFDDLKFSNDEIEKLLKNIPSFDFKGLNFNDVAFGREMTPKEKRQYEKRKKESKELQKKIDEKRKDLRSEKPMLDRPWVVSSAKTIAAPRMSAVPSSGITIFKNDNFFTIDGLDFKNYSSGEMKFFINGKEVTKAEMDKIDPKDIKNVNVNKYNDKGEIRIETK